MNRVIYSDHGLHRPPVNAPLGSNVFCFECGCGIHNNDDAHVCIECGGCNKRLEESNDRLDRIIERIMLIGVALCFVIGVKVRLFP